MDDNQSFDYCDIHKTILGIECRDAGIHTYELAISVASGPGADQSRLEPPKFSPVQSTQISHWDRTSAQFLRTGPESVWTGPDCLSWQRDY
jgi:hypothetical protein